MSWAGVGYDECLGLGLATMNVLGWGWQGYVSWAEGGKGGCFGLELARMGVLGWGWQG